MLSKLRSGSLGRQGAGERRSRGEKLASRGRRRPVALVVRASDAVQVASSRTQFGQEWRNPYRGPSQREKVYVTTVVFIVFCAEHEILGPPPEREHVYFAEIESLYERLAVRYGFHPEA